MIGQQLDLFGGPLRPPKKILVDEQPETPKESSAESKPTQEADSASNDTASIHVEIPASAITDEAGSASNGVAADVLDEMEASEVELPEDTVALEAETEAAAFVPAAEEVAGEIIPETVAPELESLPEPLGVEELDEADAADEPQIESRTETASANSDNKDKAESLDIQQVAFRGRKSGDPDEEMEMLNVPPDEELFKRQYYSMRETAAMFNVNQALLRFWENEFDILQPKKNKKGDRYFRPVDVKNLVLIYHLLRVRKFTMEGAKDYLHTHKKAGDSFQLVQRLEKLKSFLLELKANL